VRQLRHRVPAKQLWRFAFTGTVVAALYFAVLTGLVVLADVPAQVALVFAFVSAVVVHFTLNRQFVFGSETTYTLHLTAQGVRYLGVALASYLVNAVALATLPGLTGLPELAVVAVTTGVVTAFTFVALRGWVFRASTEPTDLAARLSSGSR
jgi:putative flippase GtrA